MPPPITGPRRYVKRDALLDALEGTDVPNLTQLADVLGVHRVHMSRVANGHDPLADQLEAELRTVLGVSAADPVAWIETR